MTKRTRTTKRPRVLRTPANYDENYSIKDVEVPFGKTLTAPDQTMSIRHQLARFQSGKINGMANPIFMDEDDEAPDFSKMDQIEIIQWRERALIEQQAIDARFKQASQALAKQQDDERIQQAAQALLAATTPTPSEA